MSKGALSFPLVALGAAGAFTLASLFHRRTASAAIARPPATQLGPTPTAMRSSPTAPPLVAPVAEPSRAQSAQALRLDFGRPVPVGVRAILGSGWANPRGAGTTRRLHRAIDIGLPIGTPILAIDHGLVTHAQHQDRGAAGIWLAVQHPSGVTSRYLHLSAALVQVGQRVQRGEQIARSGDTGSPDVPHLHLDLRVPASLLPAIEAAISRPRSGWGPELPPFGHAIPGEPWIPVDAYREGVRAEAAAMGIPLREPGLPRNGAFKYRPVGDRGEPYPEWLRRVRGSSGVYIIRERGGHIVYVGVSVANRLYETLTRHFQEWRRYKGFWRGQYAEGHDPGLTYDRASVEVAVKVTSPEVALDEEARLIRRLRPRDNLLGQPDLEEAPF